MSLISKILTTLGVIVLAVTVIWWVGIRDSATELEPVPSQAEKETQSGNTNAVSFRTGAVTRTRAPNVPVAEVSVATTNLMTDWEERVDQILGDDSEVEDKARKMLELLPHFPEAGQVETAQHISNLLPDEDYAKFGAYLTNATTAGSVQDVILADVLNRPSEIKLPLLLETARNPDNAKAAEAKEMLELYLEEDYGTDWNKWEEEMNKWLKENPD